LTAFNLNFNHLVIGRIQARLGNQLGDCGYYFQLVETVVACECWLKCKGLACTLKIYPLGQFLPLTRFTQTKKSLVDYRVLAVAAGWMLLGVVFEGDD
jgi:hypothetical protein